MLVVALAELDGLDGVVEPLEGRARLLVVAEAERLPAAGDGRDGRDHRRRAAGTNLGEVLDLLPALARIESDFGVT